MNFGPLHLPAFEAKPLQISNTTNGVLIDSGLDVYASGPIDSQTGELIHFPIVVPKGSITTLQGHDWWVLYPTFAAAVTSQSSVHTNIFQPRTLGPWDLRTIKRSDLNNIPMLYTVGSLNCGSINPQLSKNVSFGNSSDQGFDPVESANIILPPPAFPKLSSLGQFALQSAGKGNETDNVFAGPSTKLFEPKAYFGKPKSIVRSMNVIAFSNQMYCDPSVIMDWINSNKKWLETENISVAVRLGSGLILGGLPLFGEISIPWEYTYDGGGTSSVGTFTYHTVGRVTNNIPMPEEITGDLNQLDTTSFLAGNVFEIAQAFADIDFAFLTGINFEPPDSSLPKKAYKNFQSRKVVGFQFEDNICDVSDLLNFGFDPVIKLTADIGNIDDVNSVCKTFFDELVPTIKRFFNVK